MLDPGFWILAASPTGRRLQATGKCRIGGEDRNRTYLGSACAGPTTVLKTARATRHPSLSERMKTSNLPSPGCDAGGAQYPTRLRRGRAPPWRASNVQLNQKIRKRIVYLIFLIAVTMESKSGQSPDSSLEWSSFPLARISKAPPLEGMRVSDAMRSPSSRILVAKLTAFGV
jgi:hypothetical protein